MRITKMIAKERPVHFELNHESRTLSGSNGVAHKLGGKEFMILKRLAETPNKRVPTADLLNIAWEHSPDAELSYVARSISDLRQKLGDTEPTKRFIDTADSGYVLIAKCEHRDEQLPPRPHGAGKEMPPAVPCARAFQLVWLLIHLTLPEARGRAPKFVEAEIEGHTVELGLSLPPSWREDIVADDKGTRLQQLVTGLAGQIAARKPQLLDYFQGGFNLILTAAKRDRAGMKAAATMLRLPERLREPPEEMAPASWLNEIHSYFENALRTYSAG